MSRILAVLSAVFLAGALVAAEPAPLPDKDAPDFFPLMAWNILPEHFPRGSDPAEQLRLMREAGFTIAGIVEPETVPLVAAAGLWSFVYDRRGTDYNLSEPLSADWLRPRIQQVVADTRALPGVYGFYLRDEPVLEQLASLGTLAKVFRECAPDLKVYVNLHPNYAPAWAVGNGGYRAYLDAYLRAFGPAPLDLDLCVDNYYLAMTPEHHGRFYENMRLMRDKAREGGTHFWSVVLSMAHYQYRLTPAILAHQVYASLAYGARGLNYFCYFDTVSENTDLAPIDRHGDPTTTYAAVRSLNKSVRALAPTLNRLAIQRNYFLGPVPQGGEAPPADALIALTAESAKPTILVGEFRHDDGAAYVMLVNVDAEQIVQFNFAFRDGRKARWVSDATGDLVGIRPAHIYMSPGMGTLLRLDD